jgi:hypothetical protein
MKKKMMMLAALAAVAGMTAGCFTKAVAYTKTNPDGSKESRVSIVGTGDKASQVAAEGLFADGAAEDLGAGVKSAKASQESTGIQGTLAGMGTLLNGMAQFMAASQRIPVTPVAVPEQAAKASAPTETVAITDSGSAAPDQKEAQTVAGTNSAVTVVILGDRASCSLCRSLWSYLDAAALSASLCGASVVDADRTDAPAAFGKYRPSSGFSYPLVRVYGGSALKGEFVARGLDQASFTAKAKALAPSCPSE